MNVNELLPVKMLNKWRADYPSLISASKRAIDLKSKGELWWPDFCLIPTQLARIDRKLDDGVSLGELDISDRELYQDNSTSNGLAAARAATDCILQLLGSWRLTQGYYKFDSSVISKLIETADVQPISTEVLLRLPEWVVYIDAPLEINKRGGKFLGFFAGLVVSSPIKSNISRDLTGIIEPYLRLGLVSDKAPDVPFVLDMPLKNGDTVHSAMSKYWETLTLKHKEIRKHIGDSENPATVADEAAKYFTPTYSAAVSLLLYLCSQNADITCNGKEEFPAKPKPVKTRKGDRLFVPSMPKIWDVGYRVGAEIRRAETMQREWQGGTHNTPRPHIRRAHWHTFLTGKGRSEQVLKWVPPTLVNMSGSDISMPVVERTIKDAKQ